jgi:hypothetical protein
MDPTTGFAAALASTVFFGSFGVPIKSQAIVQAQVDPVVFQCYKTAACFCSSWLALLFVDFKFTVGAGGAHALCPWSCWCDIRRL